MNLENLNLVELNAQEVQEIVGGGFFNWIWNKVLVSGFNDVLHTTLNTVNDLFRFLGTGMVERR